MKAVRSRQGWIGRKAGWIVGAIALASTVAFFGFRAHRTALRQAEVATKGAQVMPFDLEQTRHRFKPLDNGGLQTVTAKDSANQAQIDLIQMHLQEEAAKFQAGNFASPAAIHGHEMPGLKALSAGHTEIAVQYRALSNGGEIRYTAQSAPLTQAIHDWFAAQRSDHGRHAH